MSFPLLQTKLFIPLNQNLLPRDPLIDVLNKGRIAGHRLVLVSSSAGSGKTSLLSEWASHHPGEFCWLSLDIDDNEPDRFWKYVIAALQRAQPEIGQNAAKLLDSPQPVPSQTILVSLLNEISNDPKPLVLILDDYHLISNQEIHAGIGFLLEHLPPHSVLVISTRADPPLPIVRLRAHALLTEIREVNLRFSVDEAASFLKSMGLNLSMDDIQAIENRTEGWVAGLQLVSLAIKARSLQQDPAVANPQSFISAFAGSHQHILDYLSEEVLSHLDQSIQDFLVKTSILGLMCAELCEAVVTVPDGSPVLPLATSSSCRSVLNFLDRSNLFTIPMDEEHHWFRYHHLFADLLSNKLIETRSTIEIQGLHRRASEWLARNGQIEEAVRHALLAQDFALAALLIEPLAQLMMFNGRVNTLKNWIYALPETCLQTHLRLKIYGVWIELMQGICELNRQKVQETEQLIHSLPVSPENNQLKVELMVVLCRFIAISGDSVQAIRVAHEALAVISDTDLASRARVQSALAIAHGLEGNITRSNLAFQECLRLARLSGYYSLAAHTSMLVGLGNSHYGKLREPARYLQEIVDQGSASGQKEFFPAGQGYIGLASIYLEWNDLETAENYLEQGIGLCSRGGLDGVFSGSILKARLLQAKGDLRAALEEIQSVEKTFQRKDHDTAARQVQILLAMGNLEAASQWITPLTGMIAADPAAVRVPFLFLEDIKITLARILLARGEATQALSLLDQIQIQAESDGRFGHLMEVYTLKALAFQKQQAAKIIPLALENLELALKLAEPENFTLIFVEMGVEIIPVLNAVVQHATTADSIKKYALKLLAAFPMVSPDAGISADSNESSDLSQREIEILKLIGSGCSNQEIADRLFITLHTVKKHGSHIFAKLGVTSRTQAIVRARQVGLLE
jgi:LuxR family transcriptional regulator, maltose regulon positive regulatory protein